MGRVKLLQRSSTRPRASTFSTTDATLSHPLSDTSYTAFSTPNSNLRL